MLEFLRDNLHVFTNKANNLTPASNNSLENTKDMNEEKKYTIDEFKTAMRTEINRWHNGDKKRWTNQELAYYGFAVAACLHLSGQAWDTLQPPKTN